MQEEPQLLGLLFDTHCPPQAWKPLMQRKPHVVPLHVATPAGGVGQGLHDFPQLETEVLLLH